MRVMKGFYVDSEWVPRPEVYFSAQEMQERRSKRGCNGWKNVVGKVRNDIPIPVCADTEVLIRVKTCGVCGSDQCLFDMDMDGYTSYSSQCSFPVIIGHEFSGEIVEVGSRVTGFRVGEKVTAENHLWCGECVSCRKGEVNHCERMMCLGFDRGKNGSMSEYIAVDQKYCWSLGVLESLYSGQDLFDVGAMIEPLSCVYEGLVNASKGIHPGDHVVIMGAGGMGLMAIQLVKTLGAAKIIVFEPERVRQNIAITMGADYVLDPFDNAYLRDNPILDITHGQGIGMAIEASRNPARNFPLIESAMQVGGEILCISIAAQYPRIDYMRLVRNKITFSGAYGHAGHNNFLQIINLLESNRLMVLPAITARFSLDNAMEAIIAGVSGKEGKVVIVP